MYYTSICCIAKDEDPYLREWVSYHLAIGFEHIILYDNNSKNKIKDILKDYVATNLVTVYDLPLTEHQQLSAYVNCIKVWKNLVHWIAFIDIDEFIVPLTTHDIRDFLDDYIDYAVVGVHWNIFSSNGYLRKSSGSVIKKFRKSLGLNEHIKSIVQPKKVIKPLSPHHFQYTDSFCVNEDFVCIPSHCSYPIANKIVLNHYYFKSQQEFEEKIARGLVTKMHHTVRSLQAFYDHIHQQETIDLRALKLLNELSPLLNVSVESMSDRITNLLAQAKEIETLLFKITDLITLEKLNHMYVQFRRYANPESVVLFEIYKEILINDYNKAISKISNGLANYPNYAYYFYQALKTIYEKTNRTNDVNSLVNFIEN